MLCPKGLYEFDDETLVEKLTEEFAIPSTEELKSLEAWAHRHMLVLMAGRISHTEPIGLSEEEKDEYMAKLGENDPVGERYKAINEDKPIDGMETAWLSKIVGDP